MDNATENSAKRRKRLFFCLCVGTLAAGCVSKTPSGAKQPIDHKVPQSESPLSRGPDQRLLAASKQGQIAGALLAIQQGANVNWETIYRSSDGKVECISPMNLSIREGHTELMERLIIAGAVVNRQDAAGLTPLVWAVLNGRYEAAKVLVNHGADVDARTNPSTGEMTPLIAAAFRQDGRMCQLLLDHGAKLELLSGQVTPLLMAIGSAEGGNGEALRVLLHRGARLDVGDEDGLTPLHYAAKIDLDSNLIVLLIQKGASPNAKDKLGRRPLHLAAGLNCIGAVRTLLKVGADPKAKDNYGNTPLDYARIRGHKECITLLRLPAP